MSSCSWTWRDCHYFPETPYSHLASNWATGSTSPWQYSCWFLTYNISCWLNSHCEKSFHSVAPFLWKWQRCVTLEWSSGAKYSEKINLQSVVCWGLHLDCWCLSILCLCWCWWGSCWEAWPSWCHLCIQIWRVTPFCSARLRCKKIALIFVAHLCRIMMVLDRMKELGWLGGPFATCWAFLTNFGITWEIGRLWYACIAF